MFFKEIVAAISFFFRLRALCFFHGLSDLVKGLFVIYQNIVYMFLIK